MLIRWQIELGYRIVGDQLDKRGINRVANLFEEILMRFSKFLEILYHSVQTAPAPCTLMLHLLGDFVQAVSMAELFQPLTPCVAAHRLAPPQLSSYKTSPRGGSVVS